MIKKQKTNQEWIESANAHFLAAAKDPEYLIAMTGHFEYTNVDMIMTAVFVKANQKHYQNRFAIQEVLNDLVKNRTCKEDPRSNSLWALHGSIARTFTGIYGNSVWYDFNTKKHSVRGFGHIRNDKVPELIAYLNKIF